MSEKEYISVTDTAKLVRGALKTAFPSVKFSVRSSSYSGGASIDVSWMDGPREQAVEKVAKVFEGSTFDGMIDLKSYHTSTLVNEDGTTRAVHFGADYVFCRREVTNRDKLDGEAEALIRQRCAVEGEKFGNQWVGDLAHGMTRDLDFLKGETLEDTFQRVVLRR